MRIAVGLVLLCLIGVVVLAVMRGQRSAVATDGKLSVAASYYPLYEFARQVGGSDVAVTNVTPAGVEPHEYEPSPQALARVDDADVFIYNGGTLEPWASKFVQQYTHTAIRASDGMALLPVTGEDAGNHTATDPHFWLDPVLAQQAVATIRDAFSRADPNHAAGYARRAAAYSAQLAELDKDFRSALTDCRLRTIVTSHAAFAYLAQRYDLHVITIAGVSPEQEPDAATMAAISRTVKQDDIHYIFFEKLVSPRLADTIARETGARTLVFDPVEGLDEAAQRQGKNYITIQRDNIGVLHEALACQ